MRKRVKLNLFFFEHHFNIKKAFTIVELLVFISISALVLTVVWQLFSNTIFSVRSGTDQINITKYFRIVMLYMKDDIDNAREFEINSDGFKLKKVIGIDEHSNPVISDVEYLNIAKNIKRLENGKEKVFGDSKLVEIGFTTQKKFIEEANFSKYEISVLLSGKGLKNSTVNNMDSIELMISPQMMSVNKIKFWTQNPSVNNK